LRVHVFVLAASLCTVVACPKPTPLPGAIKVDQNPSQPTAASAVSIDAGDDADPACVSVATSLDSLADKIDQQLAAACGALASDLGAAGTFASAKDACDAAVQAIGTTKTKLGANAIIAIDIDPAHCGLDLEAYADCAARCDPARMGRGMSFSSACEPGKLYSICDAECIGECELPDPAPCSATCEGSCDAGFRGKCSGTCNGKCNGQPSNAVCSGGICEGACDSGLGACAGNCSGRCTGFRRGRCAEFCSGECTSIMRRPVCMGSVVSPAMREGCALSCGVAAATAAANAPAMCTAGYVDVLLNRTADAEAAATFQAAMVKDLPRVSAIADGMANIAANVGVCPGSGDRMAADVRLASSVIAAATHH
jgi:hypothetical protein